MKQLKFLLFGILMTAFLPPNGLASGVMTISGKLISTTETQYLVQTGKSVYFIQRRAISPGLTRTLDKIGAPVTLTVPLEAITLVKSRKNFPS